MDVFADYIFLEETISAIVRRSGQADEIGVEILQNLKPEIVNREMAFVDDDEIEKLGRNLAVVDNRHGLFGLDQFCRVGILGVRIHLLTLQVRVHTLDGTDADLTILGDEGRCKSLDCVEFGELAVVVTGQVGH